MPIPRLSDFCPILSDFCPWVIDRTLANSALQLLKKSVSLISYYKSYNIAAALLDAGKLHF